MSRRQSDIGPPGPPAFNAARLAARRLETFRTQAELARDVGVTLRQYQRWEAGTSEPQFRFVRALAVELDCEPAWFYEPTDESNGSDEPLAVAS